MADLQNGTLVQHTTLGVGKIVALEPNAVHVFFPDSDKRFVAKLRLPAARALLRTDGFEQNAWLEGLSACEAAERLGWDQGDDPSPNWGAYVALRELSVQLLESLQPNGAKDFIDVEAFLHVTATSKRRLARSER